MAAVIMAMATARNTTNTAAGTAPARSSSEAHYGTYDPYQYRRTGHRPVRPAAADAPGPAAAVARVPGADRAVRRPDGLAQPPQLPPHVPLRGGVLRESQLCGRHRPLRLQPVLQQIRHL